MLLISYIVTLLWCSCQTWSNVMILASWDAATLIFCVMYDALYNTPPILTSTVNTFNTTCMLVFLADLLQAEHYHDVSRSLLAGSLVVCAMVVYACTPSPTTVPDGRMLVNLLSIHLLILGWRERLVADMLYPLVVFGAGQAAYAVSTYLTQWYPPPINT